MIIRVRKLSDVSQGSLIEEPKKRSSKKTEAEDEFAFQARAQRLPEFRRNYQFAQSILSETGKPRKWSFDFAWLEYRVGLEIEGLVFRNIGCQIVATGRHVHPDGFREDCIKYANAALLGWTLLRFDPKQVRQGIAARFAMDVLASKGWRSETVG